MPRGLHHTLFCVLLTLSLWSGSIGVSAADNTVCASAQMDWYTDAVGETPCVTYQRLRRICNPSYSVSKFFPDTPGDRCDDQVSGCCCNSIAFGLSMLCMNCQYDTQLGEVGIDAGKGAYSLYLDSCHPRAANKTLPNDIQQGVCNKEIKIDRNIYNLFWDTEDWFYVYFKETMVKDLAATNNNTFTKCASTTRNETASTTQSVSDTITASTADSSSTSAPNADATTSSSGSKLGPIIGGVVGGVGGAIAAAVMGFFLWRARRQARGPKPLDLSNEYRQYPENEMGGVTPFTAATSAYTAGSRYDSGTLSDSTSPETHALLSSPSGPGSAGGVTNITASKYGTQPWSQAGSSVGGFDDERHMDGGPVPSLARSNSGRLPPGYGSWESEAGANDGSVVAPSSSGPTEGQSAYGGSSSTGSSEPLQPQRGYQQQSYPLDVKVRPPGA